MDKTFLFLYSRLFEPYQLDTRWRAISLLRQSTLVSLGPWVVVLSFFCYTLSFQPVFLFLRRNKNLKIQVKIISNLGLERKTFAFSHRFFFLIRRAKIVVTTFFVPIESPSQDKPTGLLYLQGFAQLACSNTAFHFFALSMWPSWRAHTITITIYYDPQIQQMLLYWTHHHHLNRSSCPRTHAKCVCVFFLF